MSIFEKPADIVARMNRIVAVTDKLLDIPVLADRHGPAQPYDLMVHDRFHILSEEKRMYGEYAVLSASFSAEHGRSLHCHNVHTGAPLDICDAQLAELEGDGRLRLLKPVVKGNIVGSPASLTPILTAIAERYKGYVEAARTQATEEGKFEPTEGTFARAIKKHAAETKDPNPPCVATVRARMKAAEQWPEIDERAYLPPTSSGNKDRHYTTAFEELVKRCVIVIKTRGNPTLADFKLLLTEALELPENEHLKPEAYKEDGNFKPSNSWFYRKLGGLNHYDVERAHFGPDRAAIRRRNRASRPLPENALDIVECDYTEVNVVVYDARYKFVYGRPHIILFRDRATGAVLGFSVFFDNPSFEAVWHGLRRALYPKDMSRYPNWFYPMYGFPSALVVDNDATLISKAVMQLANSLGINCYKARVRHPNDKSGVEQFFGKQDNHVFVNLPGSTERNPMVRKEFDESKGRGVPAVDLETLDAFIMQYICLHLHINPLTGFRHDAKTINEKWAESIVRVKNRPVINPEELLRMGGLPIKVTIRGGNTIKWKHMEFFSIDLAAICEDPLHLDWERDGASSEYDAMMDPSNIGHMVVINRYDKGSVIDVPVSEDWREYATGRRLFQHLKAIEHHNKVMKSKIESVSDLERASLRLTKDMTHLVEQLKTQRPREQLGAWLSDLGDRTTLGRRVDVPTSPAVSAEYLDPETSFAPPPVRRSPTAAPSPHGETPDRVYDVDGNGKLVEGDPAGQLLDQKTERETKKAAAEPPPRRRLSVEELRKLHPEWDND